MQHAFLIGKNIYLRALEPQDVNGDYLNWINDAQITRFMDNPFPKSRAELEGYVTEVLKDAHYIFFAIVEKKTDRHVGNLKIGPIDWIHRRTNFGRMLSKECWGKGYGAEAMKLIIPFVFDQLNLNRILEHNVAENQGAIKSNERGGLDVEGTIEEYVYADGKYQDVAIVGLTRKRYEEKKRKGFFNLK